MVHLCYCCHGAPVYIGLWESMEGCDARSTHHLLYLCYPHHRLLQLDCLHRSWYHPQKSHPRTLVQIKIQDPHRALCLTTIMLNLQDIPTAKDIPLFLLQQLCGGVRPPLSLRKQLCGQEELSLLRVIPSGSVLQHSLSRSQPDSLLHQSRRGSKFDSGNNSERGGLWIDRYPYGRLSDIPYIPIDKGEDNEGVAETFGFWR